MVSKKIRCKRCSGSGIVMGGGMMRVDCDDCDGNGKVYPDFDDDVSLAKDFVIDKRSKSYREAIKKLKSIHPDMSDSEISEIFEKEFEKL